MPAYEARQKEYASKGHKHFYFMTLNGSEVCWSLPFVLQHCRRLTQEEFHFTWFGFCPFHFQVIDACAKGNLGRFINHSCEPNCRTEKVSLLTRTMFSSKLPLES